MATELNQVTTYVSDEIRQQIQQIADSEERSFAEIMRRLLGEALDSRICSKQSQ